MIDPGVVIAERGRKQELVWTTAYFEIVALPTTAVTRIEVYAVDAAGAIIGSGHVSHYPAFSVGQVFEVKLQHTNAAQIAGWLAQSPPDVGFSLPTLGHSLGFEAASNPSNLAQLGDPVRRPFPIKHGYAGEVHVHRRTRVFHHPDCSSAKAMGEHNRIVLGSPDEAQQQRYVPCFSCMVGFGG